MKKIISIIIIKVVLQQFCFAQNHYVTRFKIPEKKTIAVSRLTASYSINPFSTITVITAEPAKRPLLVFNDQPVIVPGKPANKAIMFFTELSFSDVLENSVNNFKAGLINTYDDHMAELFKDAPSLIKVRCIISL